MRALLLACQPGGEPGVHLVQQEGASEVAEGVVEEILQLHLLEEMVGETLMGPLAGEHL